jgi:AmmeMemoRadiSam system protein B
VKALPVRRPDIRLPAAALAACGLALALSLWLAIPFNGGPAQPEAPAAAYRPSHASLFFDPRQFAAAEAVTDSLLVQPMPDARGLLVPHDWVGGRFITTPLRDLAASRSVERVILIGPNHTNVGGAAALTSDLPWVTPFGLAETDGAAVATLAASGVVRLEPEVLTYEHSVAGVVPAVHRYLPEAKVVPLILRGGLAAGEVRRLATALAPLLTEETVIVAAVDFSHGLPASAAHQHDEETLTLLHTLDWQPLLRWGNEHLDSPPAVALLLTTMQKLGATRFELRANSSSGEIAGDPASPVTSYIVGHFR